jgi:hypothetical protein
MVIPKNLALNLSVTGGRLKSLPTSNQETVFTSDILTVTQLLKLVVLMGSFLIVFLEEHLVPNRIYPPKTITQTQLILIYLLATIPHS